MRKSDFNDKFNWYSSMFAALLSISIAVYAIYLYGDDAMTQPLPLPVLALLILAGIFALLALYNGIRMIFAPKDDRLDKLIEAVKELKPNNNLASQCVPKDTYVLSIFIGIALIVHSVFNMIKRNK